MPTLTESRAAGFGLALELGPGVEPERLGLAAWEAGGDAAEPATRVAVDPEGLRAGVAAAGGRREVASLGAGAEKPLRVELLEGVGYLVAVAELGRFLVSADGAEVLCDPAPGRPEWIEILPSQVLPLAATLRGLEPFHASGAVLGGRAVLFAGPPGAGKSSLAAALVRGGAELLADDVVALELRGGGLLAHPGAALLNLREAEHGRLSTAERRATGAATPVAGKQRYAGATVAAGPVPLGALCLLERAATGAEVEPLAAPDPRELLAASFNLSVRTPARLVRQLDVAAALAASGGVFRLRVLPGRDAGALAAALVARLGEAPG